MSSSPIRKNILITGAPGVGKTTLIKRLAEELSDFCPAGFYTEEIREGGERRGFSLVSFSGTLGILSHVDIKSPHRVGKYGVDVEGFDDFLSSIPFFEEESRLVIVDEIGKMESLSFKFTRLIKQILDSDKVVVATIASRGKGLIGEIKERRDAKTFEVTHANRGTLLENILRCVRARLFSV
ncbi:MAG: NTPase [Candidatus Methanosuratincola sp.]|jgi:nucleoside-triphosphatase